MSPYPVSVTITEVQLSLDGVKVHAGCLGHHLHVDGLARLNADHQLVPLHRTIGKDVPRDVLELDPHLSLPLIECCKQVT